MAGLFGKVRIKFDLTDEQMEAIRPLVEEVEGQDAWAIFAQLLVYGNSVVGISRCEARVGLITEEVWKKLVTVFGEEEESGE